MTAAARLRALADLERREKRDGWEALAAACDLGAAALERPWRDEVRDGAVYVRIADAYVPALLEGIGPVQKMRLVQIGGEWSIEVTQS